MSWKSVLAQFSLGPKAGPGPWKTVLAQSALGLKSDGNQEVEVRFLSLETQGEKVSLDWHNEAEKYVAVQCIFCFVSTYTCVQRALYQAAAKDCKLTIEVQTDCFKKRNENKKYHPKATSEMPCLHGKLWKIAPWRALLQYHRWYRKKVHWF